MLRSKRGRKLTNRELPYYYWQQYYSLMNNYGSYASYFIDASTPFDQQMCMFDNTLTWQQYFLQAAIMNYENVSAVWQDARLNGFQLSQEDQDYLDDLGNQITLAAANSGFGSADEYLQTAYGPAATMTSYRDFVERQITASAYLQACVDEKTYTEDDISRYYDDNAESYAENGIEKSDVKMVNVRHILIQPEGKNDDGTYTDEAWAEAEKKANELLTEWKNGEHTEDSFAFMAAESSTDSGSATNGGLYEDIYPGQMVDAFDAWCFDAARLAYKEACAHAAPALIEPIYRYYIHVPNDYVGAITSDLPRRRGVMEGMNPTDDGTEVVARAPMVEMVKYATDLRSMTQARGYFTKEFIGYEDVPGAEAKKIIEQAKREDEEEE